MGTFTNPDLYHGKNKKSNFFEGWYFKIADKNNENQFAFIPGISKSPKGNNNHSFIQVLNSKTLNYKYNKFNEESFHFNNKNFKIKVDKSIFALDHIKLNISSENSVIKGKLKFNNIIKWPDSIINPGSMGFYNYLCFMECYAQVCMLDGNIEGSLSIDGNLIDFTSGKVYIEKNWGKSFPKSWIWIQSNSFHDKRATLTASLATIPFPLKDFRGFLIGVTVDDYFYSFTSINGSKVQIEQHENDVIIVASNNKFTLTIKTFSTKDKYMLCKGPLNGKMVPLVNETLCGSVSLILENIKTNSIIYKGIGESTGIEYGGEQLRLLDT